MEASRGSKLDQLADKRRTYDDLSRFIGARTLGASNYALLMGAGCSVSSNIRSALQLVEQWRREVYARLQPGKEYSPEAAVDYLTKNHAVWYNPQREYSSLFEKNFDLPRQRRMFVEQEVAGKAPNLGYAYLIRLIEEGHFNAIFTTNFDDLVNEAFFQFSSVRPIVCAHDSAISSISVTSKRPKVIKLHGDYLFDDIKSTLRETESLEDNTRRKFVEFCRDYGLVVVGYGGYDRSIMDVIQFLLRSDDYFKHGVYWCIRKGDEPSDELMKLLWRDRVYYVEIDGFDEIFAALHNDLVGNALPIDTGVVTNKPRSIIKGFCENKFLTDSPSEVIKRDLARLVKLSEREELFSAMRGAKEEREDKEGSSDDLSEKDLVVILEIKQSLSSGDLDSARLRIKQELDARPSRGLQEELADLRVRVEELAGDIPAAVAAVDALILDDPQEVENYIRKTFLVVDHQERVRVLDAAEASDPESYRVFTRRADCFIEAYQSGIFEDRKALLDEIERSFSRSLAIDSSLRNPVWRSAVDFYGGIGLPKEEVRKKLDDISAKCSAMGARKLVTLRARLYRWSKYKEDRSSEEADKLLGDITEARLASSKSNQPNYEWLQLDAYSRLGRKEDLSRHLSDLSINPELANTRDYLKRRADFLIKYNGDVHGAIAQLRQAMSFRLTRSDVIRAANLMEYIGDAAAVAELATIYANRLLPLDRLLLRRSQYVADGDLEGALAQLRQKTNMVFSRAHDKLEEVHDLLLLTRYPEAGGIAKVILDRASWNKYEYGELIINYELSQHRQGLQVNKKRLGELVQATTSEHVRGCAYFLIGDNAKSKDAFVSAMREDKEDRFSIPRWALFQDERGKSFIGEVLKAAS
jgi:NAD-dependent SIR2 family protein deacetylase